MGRFIVLEGIDGAGTTTQLGLLQEWLRAHGKEVVGTREPTGRSVGQVIRATLQKKEGAPPRVCLPWLFAADRSDHMESVVKPALQRGTWVLSDRYYHSSLAYQTLDLPFDEVMDLNKTFPIPDVTLFLKIDVDTSLQRIQTRDDTREIFETRSILETVAAQYETVNTRLRARGDTLVDIDATQTPDAVFQDILTVLQDTVL